MYAKLIGLTTIALLGLLYACPSESQELERSCDYANQEGVEFIFKSNDAAATAAWVENFSVYKNFSRSVDPAELTGTKAKITRPTTGAEYGRVLEVLTENCATLFVRNDGRILPRHEASLGITFITDVSNGWEFLVPRGDSAGARRETTHWTTREKTDPMTDAKSCSVMPSTARAGLRPLFFYHSQEGFSVGLIGADFPSREVAFRVDKNRAISNIDELTSTQSQSLVAQIRAGGSILTVSGYKWPYDYREYNEVLLDGVVGRLDYCRDAVR